ncbi:MAG: hypothetical protein CMJ81_24455 [Planctomycetaceae bacterium]|nr:hypothetical protein [Planctomycetaceae bacterium]MBP60708.1 hypothetical protein [Planctomycetaceae bacterium]
MSRNRLDELRTEHRSVKLGVDPAHRSGRARWVFPLVAVTTIVTALAIWVAGIGNIIRKDTSRSSGEHSLKLPSTSPATGESRRQNSAHEAPGKASQKSPSSSNNLLGEPVLTPRIQAKLEQQDKNLDPTEDGWETEAFHDAAKKQLKKLSQFLASPEGFNTDKLSEIVAPGFVCGSLRPQSLDESFQDETITIQRGRTAGDALEFRGSPGLISALREMAKPLTTKRDVWVRFKQFQVRVQEDVVTTTAYYEAGANHDAGAVGQTATWQFEWANRPDWKLPRLLSIRVKDYEETIVRSTSEKLFTDCTKSVIGADPSYDEQLRFGNGYWSRHLQRHFAPRLIEGLSGIAVGDANGDGLEDVYFCQPGGLQNRLYLQNPDGTVTDRSAWAGVNWLDHTSSALLIDLDNDGDQDLVLATRLGLVMMENDGSARFVERAAHQTFNAIQSISAIDYDDDGNLDLYVCFDRQGNATSEVPDEQDSFVFHDANDGGANLLLRNNIVTGPGGDWTFMDVTRETGLDKNNRRYSLAAAWEDFDNDGDLDLYVANDYGQNCLYRNDRTTDGKRRFQEIAQQAGVVDYGAGMSVSWADFNHDGWMDLYVGNMFSSAGNRITLQNQFRSDIDAETRQILVRMAKGNSLFANNGDGTFREVGGAAGVELGRWAWGSLFFDINNDGWDDLLVSNGFVTGEDPTDL